MVANQKHEWRKDKFHGKQPMVLVADAGSDRKKDREAEDAKPGALRSDWTVPCANVSDAYAQENHDRPSHVSH